MRLALLVLAVGEMTRSFYQQPDKWLFEEKFAAKPGKGWTWTREAAGGWKVEKNGLLLKAQPGSLWEKDNSAKNLLLRALPAWKPEEGSIVVEAEIAGAPGMDGEQAGVLLYQDDDHYVQVVRRRAGGGLKVAFDREMQGAASALEERDETAASHRLRIRWEGQRVSAEILPAGAPKWIPAGYCESPFTKPEAVKAGIYASGGPANTERWTRISDFKIGHAVPPE